MCTIESGLKMQHQVDIREAPDYFTFVREEKEMWIEHVAKKAKARAYSSVEEFRTDMQQILENCKSYNSPGCGRHGNPSKHSSYQDDCLQHLLFERTLTACSIHAQFSFHAIYRYTEGKASLLIGSIALKRPSSSVNHRPKSFLSH